MRYSNKIQSLRNHSNQRNNISNNNDIFQNLNTIPPSNANNNMNDLYSKKQREFSKYLSMKTLRKTKRRGKIRTFPHQQLSLILSDFKIKELTKSLQSKCNDIN